MSFPDSKATLLCLPRIAEARTLAPLPFEPELEKAATSITATEFETP
jgi:hypothetical protein